jgi:hypothetical protein
LSPKPENIKMCAKNTVKEDKTRGSKKTKLTATCNKLSFSSVRQKPNTREHLLQ